MSKGAVITIGVAAVLVLAIVAGFSGGGVESDAPAFAAVDVSGIPLPPLEDPGNDPAIGMQAPVVTGVDLDGGEIVIGEVGEPTIIMFLAHWCPHCQNEVPRVTGYLAENDLVGVSLQSVATGTDAAAPNYPPGVWFAREEWPVPVLIDDEDSTAADVYGLPAFPYWVILDGDGIVQARFTGEIPEEQFQAILDQTAALDG